MSLKIEALTDLAYAAADLKTVSEAEQDLILEQVADTVLAMTKLELNRVSPQTNCMERIHA